MMNSFYIIIQFRVTPIRHRQRGGTEQYFTTVATGGHSRLISHPAALLRWKQLKRKNDLCISLSHPLPLILHVSQTFIEISSLFRHVHN